MYRLGIDQSKSIHMSIISYTKKIDIFELSSVDFVWMVIGLHDLLTGIFSREKPQCRLNDVAVSMVTETWLNQKPHKRKIMQSRCNIAFGFCGYCNGRTNQNPH